MKTTQTLLIAVILSTGLLTATGAHAALESRLGGLAVYDTDLNITWQANADLEATNKFGLATNVDLGPTPGVVSYIGSFIYGNNLNGLMNWGGALKWIAAMNNDAYLGYNDWRLPTTLQPDASCTAQSGGVSAGFNCTGSEMGHLFYNELGGVATYSINTTHNTNYSLFQNTWMNNSYWSSTEYAPNTDLAWQFTLVGGGQQDEYKHNWGLVLAVRSGDVAAIPIPTAAWLLGSGLLGLIGVARRKAA